MSRKPGKQAKKQAKRAKIKNRPPCRKKNPPPHPPSPTFRPTPRISRKPTPDPLPPHFNFSGPPGPQQARRFTTRGPHLAPQIFRERVLQLIRAGFQPYCMDRDSHIDLFRKRKSSPKFFCPKFFYPWGHGRPRIRVPNACFSEVSRACPKFLTRDVHTNDPRTSAGYPARKLSLWAVFAFLTVVCNLFLRRQHNSGPEKEVITKEVFALEASLASPKSLHSPESLEIGQLLLYFPESGDSLESLESLKNGLF